MVNIGLCTIKSFEDNVFCGHFFPSGHVILWQHWHFVGFSSQCRPINYWHCSDKLYGIFLQHHNNVVLITQRIVKLHVIVIPIFNAVLMSDKDVNAINKGKHVLFHLSKHFDNIFWAFFIRCKLKWIF